MNKNTVFITGINGGIGKEIAYHFKNNDWNVIGTSFDNGPFSAYVVSDYIQADLSKETDIEKIGDWLKSGYKDKLVSFIHVAGYQVCKKIEETTFDDFDKVMSVNLKSFFYLSGVCNQIFAKEIKGKNSIISISSVHAHASSANIAAYAASKSALNGLMKNMAIEFAPWVRVNSISPGAINTPMLKGAVERGGMTLEDLAEKHIIGRIGEGYDVSEACYFLADWKKSGFMTGTDLKIDGGATCYLSTEVF